MRDEDRAHCAASRGRSRATGVAKFAGVAACALIAGCGSPVLTVEDALAAPDVTVKLVAYVEREEPLSLRKRVDHVTVTFFLDGREIAQQPVNGKGRAMVEWQLPSPEVSHFSASVGVDGQRLEASGDIFRWQSDRVIIAADIDGTLTRTEYKGLILRTEDKESGAMKGSRETLWELTKDYHILYFTARPRIVHAKTRNWLREQGFPPGPMVMAPGIRQMMQPGEYKRRALAALRKEWPNLLIGIGDKRKDADAYSASGMLSVIVRDPLEKDVGIHCVHVRDWKALSRFFTANRDVLIDPGELKEAIKGDRMLLEEVQPWQGG
jgi:hypothetical protein